MLRVVSGRLRGRRLVVPKGQGTRPTSDRIREAIFNILT
ncbi:MAG: RsmD family RNA methyltransferase, partial [Pseudomonadota bacterium]